MSDIDITMSGRATPAIALPGHENPTDNPLLDVAVGVLDTSFIEPSTAGNSGDSVQTVRMANDTTNGADSRSQQPTGVDWSHRRDSEDVARGVTLISYSDSDVRSYDPVVEGAPTGTSREDQYSLHADSSQAPLIQK